MLHCGPHSHLNDTDEEQLLRALHLAADVHDVPHALRHLVRHLGAFRVLGSRNWYRPNALARRLRQCQSSASPGAATFLPALEYSCEFIFMRFVTAHNITPRKREILCGDKVTKSLSQDASLHISISMGPNNVYNHIYKCNGTLKKGPNMITS